MHVTETTFEDIRALEEALHRPEIRRSRQALEALLADGFLEFGASGRVYRRDVMIELLLQEEGSADDSELHSDDYALTPISTDAVLLTYRTWRRQAYGAERHVLRSSIWKHDRQRWQILFHQGTPRRA
ncbi:DUF4440 domain-containing protein [Rhizobium sp. WYJ-E13]|uniref:nuclear transport factor 2 family protein n=1 Tax=Rhizobium sp. WYJ-E13 TaxID=2849093 RepID=UPI001C1EC807|nr:DUF4440 domain-containing protein [Rhizobium sp. WYJ-E13]QWW69826.1 DUF4440 domain-containing protein [Rhizobium sp. WYJ-E13]